MSKNILFNIRISSKMKEILNKLAKERGMSVSEYMRYLIIKETEKINKNAS